MAESGLKKRRYWRPGVEAYFLVIMILAAGADGGQERASAPEGRVDYVAEYNKLTRPEGLTDENNAWVLYEQAINAYVPMSEALEALDDDMTEERMADPNDPYWGLVAEWVQQNASALDLFRQAAQRPLFWREYTVEKPGQGLNEAFGEYMDFLKLMRDISRLVHLNINLFIHRHLYEDAAELSLVLIRSGVHMVQHKPLLISYLVGIANVRWGVDLFVELLSQHDFTAGQLAGFREALETMPRIDQVYLDAERLYALDLVQYLFGPGVRAKPNPIRWMNLYNFRTYELFSAWDKIEYAREICICAWRALLHADRQATMDRENAYYDEKKPVETHLPFEIQRDYPHIIKAAPFSSTYAVLYPMGPQSREKDICVLGAEMVFRSFKEHEALIAIVALKLYRQEKEHYPSDLVILEREGYLKRLPLDPYGGGTLKFRRVGDDFILYSLGEDMDDDGGKQTPDDWWGRSEAGGDRVFWPVQED